MTRGDLRSAFLSRLVPFLVLSGLLGTTGCGDDGIGPGGSQGLVFVTGWGAPRGPAEFNQPLAVAIGPGGEVVVADRNNHRIQVFRADGTFLRMWGETVLENPQDVAVGDDLVYVVDGGRIRKFTSQGTLLRTWGSAMRGVALDADGNVWTSLEGQILLQDPNGRELARWSGLDLVSPRGLALDGDGNVYVANTGRDHILVLDPEGDPVRSISGGVDSPTDVAVDDAGDVYFTDLSGVPLKVDPAGGPMVQLVFEGRAGHELYRPFGVALGSSGGLWVTDSGNHQVKHFENDGSLLAAWGTPVGDPGNLDRPVDLALAPDGTVLVLDAGAHRVERYTALGLLLDGWGQEGSGAGEFIEPRGIAAGPFGDVYVADGNSAQRFSPDGGFVSEVGVGVSNTPIQGIGVDPNGVAFLGELGEIHRFDDQDQFLDTWTLEPVADGSDSPVALDIEAFADRVYVLASSFVDRVDHVTVQEYQADGAFLKQWTVDTGFLPGVTSLAVDEVQGSIYVVDSVPPRILEYDGTGRRIASLGKEGIGPGELQNPWGLALDGEGCLYLSDPTARRVQRFRRLRGE